MRRFLSISSSPGTTGTYFYNSFFRFLGVEAVYVAWGVSNIEETLHLLRAKDIAGISVSMPFKRLIIPYLDVLDSSVLESGSCNTIKIDNGKWKGFNTDVHGVIWSLSKVPPSGTVKLLGDGAMSRLYQQEMKKLSRKFVVFSRKKGNWTSRHDKHSIAINTTALGTINRKSPLDVLDGVTHVIDLALKGGDLLQQTKKVGACYVSGLEFYKRVFLSQFYLYTEIRPDPKLFDDYAALGW